MIPRATLLSSKPYCWTAACQQGALLNSLRRVRNARGLFALQEVPTYSLIFNCFRLDALMFENVTPVINILPEIGFTASHVGEASRAVCKLRN
jgi:hypothetical protein